MALPQFPPDYQQFAQSVRGLERWLWRRCWDAHSRLGRATLLGALATAAIGVSLVVLDWNRGASGVRGELGTALLGGLVVGVFVMLLERSLTQDATTRLRTDIRLRGRDLSAIDLAGEDLSGLHLKARDMSYANLKGTNLDSAQLDNATLDNATLDHASLRNSSLIDASLTHADCFVANLSGARLLGANFSQARLDYADMRQARLANANLSGARCASVKFRGADLTGANLCEADLTSADLSGSRLDNANLKGARYNRSSEPTIWPEGFRVEDHDLTEVFVGAWSQSGAFTIAEGKDKVEIGTFPWACLVSTVAAVLLISLVAGASNDLAEALLLGLVAGAMGAAYRYLARSIGQGMA